MAVSAQFRNDRKPALQVEDIVLVIDPQLDHFEIGTDDCHLFTGFLAHLPRLFADIHSGWDFRGASPLNGSDKDPVSIKFPDDESEFLREPWEVCETLSCTW